MRASQVATITKREYLTRLKTKGFWLGTLMVPIFMAAWGLIPALLMSHSRARLDLTVVDLSGRLAKPLEAQLEGRDDTAPGAPRAAFDPAAAEKAAKEMTGTRFSIEVLEPAPAEDFDGLRATLDARILDEEIQAWLWIPEDILEAEEPRGEYHAASVSNVMTQGELQSALADAVREQRLTAAGYDSEEIGSLTRGVELRLYRTTTQGSRAEGGAAAFFLPVALMAILYTTILMYGTQLMNGVMEEKASRIVEVMLATVSSTELMAGKFLGICALGLTQLGIWITSALVVTAPGVVASVVAMPEGVTLPTLSPAVLLHFVILFLLGFLLYASPYAILGAAFNTQDEAQQMSGVMVVFFIAPWLLFMPVLNDPDGTLAIVTSLIPPLTPMILMLRIAAKVPPLWQILLAELLLGAACVGAVWLTARIYRVGILMYGKKPTLKEIARWARYA
ncbi:MAG: ABC transporter permease [Thermoanaerobaculia bacterium]